MLQAPPSTIHARLSAIIDERFPNAGIQVRMFGPDQGDGDVYLEREGKPLIAGEVRHLNPASAVGIEGLVARGALRQLRLQGSNLLVLVVPRLTAGMIHEASGNLATMLGALPTMEMPFNWVVMATQGGAMINLPAWNLSDFRADMKTVRLPDFAGAAEPLAFTDANQAALKCLLYASLAASHQEWEPTWWGGRTEGYASIGDLATAAKIGSASAYRLMGGLWDRSLAIPRHAALAQVDELLEHWLLARARETQPRWFPVRPIQVPSGAVDKLTWLRRAGMPSQLRVAVSGWGALVLHKQSIVPALREDQAIALTVHSLMDVEGTTEALRLIPCDRAQAWFLIGQAHQPRTAFAGIVHIDGLPAVDLWQAALDVESDPIRGHEQAEQVKHLLAITS